MAVENRYTEAELVAFGEMCATTETDELKAIIRDALKVLHRTDVSKRAIATRMRAAIGLAPGERVA